MLQKLQQVLRSLLSSVCGENPDAEGAGVGPDWPWERLWAGREKGWVGNEPSVLEREGNWLNPGDGYHVSNPLREFQGMRVGLIQEYCSQNQPLTPAKMVQKGCLADFNGSGQSSCGVLFILSFPLAGRGTSWFLRLSLYFSWLPSPWSKNLKMCWFFAPDAHTGVAVPAVAGFEVFLLTSRWKPQNADLKDL